jgi:hypothetical protein
MPVDKKCDQEGGRRVLKYRGLIIVEITCNLKTKMIPIITGASGNPSESFRKTYLEVQKFYHANIVLYEIYCNHRIAVTLYTVTTNNNNNNIPWKQIILILKYRNIYGRKVDFVVSALINVACVFRRLCFYFIKYRLPYKTSGK